MPEIHEYRCTNCGGIKNRDDLTVKKVVFMEMGTGASTKRSRVTAWLCPSCLVKDEDYKREAFVAPGNKAPMKKRGSVDG